MIISYNLNILTNYFIKLKKGFWGFGEQYVTERRTSAKTLRIALNGDPGSQWRWGGPVRGVS